MTKYLRIFLFLTWAGVAMAAIGNEIMLLQNSQARAGISLDGQWNIIPDPYETGYYNHRFQARDNGYFLNETARQPGDLVEYNFANSQKLQVPGDWNTQDDKFFFYEGTIWYQRDFTINKKVGQRYFIHFGAVNYKSIVYINGKKVGEHEGGFTPFQFEVTELLNSNNNSVVVKVDNRRERDQVPTVNTDWWNYGGITRQVRILTVPQDFIYDYFVQFNNGAIQGWVNVAAGATGTVDLSIPELEIAKTIKLNKTGRGEFTIPAVPELWSPATPKRYRVELRYGTDQIQDQIGFRTIAVRGEDILLNGESQFLKGISIHEEAPGAPGRAWSEDDARTLLHWAKQLGCNFVRLAHYPHNEHMVRVADEMGLLVWSEIPVYWTVLFDNKAVYQKAEQQLAEMISRDKNRASIILWSMANETPADKTRTDFIKKLADKARKLDPSRLITAALDTHNADANGRIIDDPLAAQVDVIGINNYCGWYGGTPASCAEIKWRSKYNKPVIMSEFGAGALQGHHGDPGQRWTEEYQVAVYQNNLIMVDQITSLRGLTPWILKDFRSPRRPLPNIQDFWNRKGLISENGIKKQAWFVLNEFYNNKVWPPID